MTTKEALIHEIDKIPETLLGEVLDFVKFLESKLIEYKLGTTLMSEASLAKDWLKPEEDEAWKDL